MSCSVRQAGGRSIRPPASSFGRQDCGELALVVAVPPDRAIADLGIYLAVTRRRYETPLLVEPEAALFEWEPDVIEEFAHGGFWVTRELLVVQYEFPRVELPAVLLVQLGHGI